MTVIRSGDALADWRWDAAIWASAGEAPRPRNIATAGAERAIRSAWGRLLEQMRVHVTVMADAPEFRAPFGSSAGEYVRFTDRGRIAILADLPPADLHLAISRELGAIAAKRAAYYAEQGIPGEVVPR